MRVSITDLPPNMQEQVLKKFQAEQQKKLEKMKQLNETQNITEEENKKKKNKFKNIKTTINEIHFDSKKEANRYNELMLMLQADEIEDLKLQPDFTLQEAYTTPDGKRIKAIRYKADFSYKKNGKLVVEDVKSKATKTPIYSMKRKMMAEKYGIDIVEI